MANKTNAIRALERRGVAMRVHEYAVDEQHLDARTVAALLGVEAARVFKTLVTVGSDGGHYAFCLPGDAELDLGKAARAVGVKSVQMLPLRELHPLTGYVHGGCSPFGMRTRLPTAVDETVILHESVFVSGGERGLQIELAPADLLAEAGAETADLTR